MKNLSLLGTLCFSLTVALVGCGDDSGNNKNKEDNGISTVETLEDLVHCTQSHYGELVYVEEKEATYECTSNDWVVADRDDLDKSSSSAVSESDTNKVDFVKVDSATVSGFAQKGPFVSGSAVTLYGLNKEYEKTSNKFTTKVANDSGAFSIKDVVLDNQYAEIEVNGFYYNALTGKKTSGTKTKLSALVDLSQGSKTPVNVNLFTEFEKGRVHTLIGEGLNVPAAKKRASQEILNIFGKTFNESNDEIDDDFSVTSLSLADTSNLSAALYAVGIMMTINQSVSKSNSLIAKVAEDIADNGAWTDTKTRASIADDLYKQDSLDGFAAARSQLKSWKLATVVPDFESNLRYFWNQEYGLGQCTDSLEAAEAIRKAENKGSVNDGAGFACSSKRWHKVSPLDTKLGLCTTKKNGQFTKADGGSYYQCNDGSWYVASAQDAVVGTICDNTIDDNFITGKDGKFWLCRSKEWISVDSISTVIEEPCLAENDSTFYGPYACVSGKWKELSVGESATKKFCTKDLQDTVFGDYACVKGKWREANELEIIGSAVCREKIEGTWRRNEDTIVYCQMAVDDYQWRYASVEEYEAESVCDESTKNKVKNGYSCVDSNGTYVWRVSTDDEIIGGSVCTAANVSNDLNVKDWKSTDGVHYVVCEDECVNGSDQERDDCYSNGVTANYQWVRLTDNEVKAKGICGKTLNSYTVNNGLVCEYRSANDSYYFRIASSKEVKAGEVCRAYIVDKVVSSLKCAYNSSTNTYSWVDANSSETTVGVACNENNLNTIIDGYICVYEYISSSWGYSWRNASMAEVAIGKTCSSNNLYSVAKGQDDKWYSCTDDGWQFASDGDVATDTICYNKVESMIKNGYFCEKSGSEYAWRVATEGEIATGKICKSSMVDAKNVSKVTDGYICEKSGSTYQWRKANPGEIALGRNCDKSVLGNYYIGYNYDIVDTLWLCQENKNFAHPYDFKLMQNGYKQGFETSKGYYWYTVINGRFWMAENIRSDSTKRCYGGKLSNCQKYGAFFLDYEYDNICPTGSVIPSEQDWSSLHQYVKKLMDTEEAAPYLKSDTTWKTNPGYNSYNMNFMASGYGDSSHQFKNFGKEARFMTSYYYSVYNYSTKKYERVSSNHYYWRLSDSDNDFESVLDKNASYVNVRCVMSYDIFYR